jgi:cell division protein FtsQ
MNPSVGAMPLPLDVRLMTLATSVLGWVLVALGLAAVGLWAVRHPVWTVRAIEVQGQLAHQNEVSFRAHLASRLRGSFITLDLAEVQRVFEAVPWVRKAVVQREFPNRIKVTVEEHRAVAWWGGSGGNTLVNAQGEVFEASAEDDDTDALPEWLGPEGQAPLVMALHEKLRPPLERLGLGLQRLELTAQGGWRAVLDNGARLELGRGQPADIEQRVQRLVATLTQVTARHGRALESADLRYPEGYAVRLRGITTVDSTTTQVPPRR